MTVQLATDMANNTKAKKVLKELSTWIKAGGPGCAYIMPDQVPLFDALAARLGAGSLDFVGDPKAPKLNL